MNNSVAWRFEVLMIILFVIVGEAENYTISKLPGFTPSEICDNAIDDDGDGQIDLNDSDCDCLLVESESLIPNHSFEDMNCCPGDYGQLRCSDFWIQASIPTTDYIHDCGYLGPDEFPAPRPYPDGDGILGIRDGVFNDGMVNVTNIGPIPSWKEYAGACLNFPLISDSAYLMQFSVGFVNDLLSPPINIAIFGTTDCANLPFGGSDAEFGCPTNGPDWIELGSTMVGGLNRNIWVDATISIKTDQDITAIAIGPACKDHPRQHSVYYFLDELFLAEDETFDLRIRASNHVCSDDYILSVPSNSGFIFQWYKNGIALVDETDPALSRMYGEGLYQVRLLEGLSCRLSKAYSYVKEFDFIEVSKSICESELFEFGNNLISSSGIYRDTLKNINSCDSIVELELKVFGEFADTIIAKIFQGEAYVNGNYNISEEGQHCLSIASSQGCDSLIILDLSYYQLYIPNAFSPNNDGINDVFTAYGDDEEIKTVNIKIYNRWGTEIHQGASWDGLGSKNPFNLGLYAYVAQVVMSDGREKQLVGSVTLVR